MPERNGVGRAIWAAVLSLLLAGVGQVYAGQRRLGYALALLYPAARFTVLYALTLLAPSPAAIVVLCLLLLLGALGQVGLAILAFRHVRRHGAAPRTQWWQSSWIAVCLVLVLGWVIDLAEPRPSWGSRNFSISSSSNLPTLQAGDFVLADMRMAGTMPAPGDMVAFRSPRHERLVVLSRVVAVEGDRVQMQGGRLVVNGRPASLEALAEAEVGFDLPEPKKALRYRETLANGRSHLILKLPGRSSVDDTPEYLVPDGHFFSVGDNRDNSVDSRPMNEMGFVPVANVAGRAAYVIWANDLGRILERVE